MFDILAKSGNGLFIGREFLPCVWVESIAWKDERAALVTIEGIFSQKESIDQIVNGVTIDLMHGCGGKRRDIRDGQELLLSMVDIYDVEKVMWNPVINSPDEEERTTISAVFNCSLEFYELCKQKH